MVGRFLVCLTAVFLGLLVLQGAVSCCFDPSDMASIEVVLNKPGVSYDLSPFKELSNVVVVNYSWGGKAYLYRSHLSNEVVVLVSTQKLYPDSSESYLTVRVESEVTRVEESVVRYLSSIVLGNLNVTPSLLTTAEKMGWVVNAGELSHEGPFKVTLTKTDNSTRVTVMLARMEAEGNIIAEVTAEDSREIAEDEVRKLISALFGLEIDVRLEERRTSVVRLKPKVGEEELKSALDYELRWLIRIGVLRGIGGDDLEKILDVARPGLAGWNSRIVYDGGSWKPYHEVEGAVLVKVTGCGWNYPIEEIPETPPSEPSPTITSGGTQPKDLENVLVAISVALLTAMIAYLIIRRI